MTIYKLLVANRGEIAVRIIRAARDAGITSVAVYADTDDHSLFVALADEAFALGGSTPAESYLDQDKLIDIALRSGADAVHPGYGFLSENAQFAQKVIDAGLIWVGPPPSAIEQLGDKVQARHIAQKVGAPLVPGTPDPVTDAEEVLAFVDTHGLPIAIKAAFGGGGRGLKVAYTREEVREKYESATREAVTAFGRGECFVERYLDKPRHVETQCLADQHGRVVVVSTRDCSLQRRHQKLIEEAPAPFLTDAQEKRLYEASRAILQEANYVGAGTCEFLIGLDGTISFLEVNTRLQVEHPVSEQVTGWDLVRWQLDIADGAHLPESDPVVRGHSIEMRINAEDAARGFLPAPGTLTRYRPPCGPGVRMDEGYKRGMSVPGAFDSLIGKLIIFGTDRDHALARARRALDEFEVEGMPTVLPFHRVVLNDAAFTAPCGDFRVHTSWIESEFSGKVEPYVGELGEPTESEPMRTVVVEVNGRRVEVKIPSGLGGHTDERKPKKPNRRARSTKKAEISGNDLTSPMQGTIVKAAVANGTRVDEGDLVVVLEAMKMEQPILAHRSGVVTDLIAAGTPVGSGDVICQIKD
ncbi:acetyl-/propionyl-CoA carboxylase, biotin carboxylase, biotin carboxyl carrier protein [Propionibacterium sp. oral taxon 192 str. F0372]|uniref:ATP-binding protein n=1 Tax=Propionibacterium sp. oral taxon 192 TaxID=671222 RepID=UPI000352EF23|nr:biotin carboxylase N-terminal domain-containing protein [Propionibacterium sp. oral taxon 192]EPH02402.1 acetyl-/propionyl-CoA carboxylase, biotin carboxylase, biotin carboxyl carrier protein [Propionibacterium sp. oral taxon 192 str. F0372]